MNLVGRQARLLLIGYAWTVPALWLVKKLINFCFTPEFTPEKGFARGLLAVP